MVSLRKREKWGSWGGAGGYSTSVIERLEGGELAGIRGGGNDTQRQHNQTCDITVMKQREKVLRKKYINSAK